MHEIARSVLPGELVFDIGAHAGDKTDWFVKRGARVVAVEPQPKMADTLRERFAGSTNVTVVQKGLSQVAGMMQMHVNSASPAISTFSDQWRTGRFAGSNWDEKLSVDMTTLDDLVSEHGSPRYAKIDVEGYKKEVMLDLSRRIGVMSIEFTTELFQSTRDALWYARGLGYKSFNFSSGEKDRFDLSQWTLIEDAIQKLGVTCSADPVAWGDVYFF